MLCIIDKQVKILLIKGHAELLVFDICMPPKELWEAYSNHTVRPSFHPSVRPSVPLRVQCISPIFLDIGIPNLVCGCILGWQSVTVTLTLPSYLGSRNCIESGQHLLYSLR